MSTPELILSFYPLFTPEYLIALASLSLKTPPFYLSIASAVSRKERERERESQLNGMKEPHSSGKSATISCSLRRRKRKEDEGGREREREREREEEIVCSPSVMSHCAGGFLFRGVD